ncbi:hypothetical protein CC1G_11790 [Coprinopsis cinerea okayama7|uniref:Uncharacterized protein n=1 Tax=Coprinopsis cinerea (strain Okayama-7 / 130 / ATCC MYA-4618 / FGSC 9003) TaxID=240176 RepID=A8NPK7_COPC7|nr:hypothetical protein CC1G_11790 [Coprinopsis cinerea okayama7\|eukprot:XP_001835356.1 hypothetical protein CC1G_11790 [Coprinopsis cinerea okayama7\
MAPKASVYDNAPQPIKGLSNANLKRLAATLFVLTILNTEHLISAGHLAEIVKADQFIRSSGVPHRLPYNHNVIVMHINAGMDPNDPRRFIEWDTENMVSEFLDTKPFTLDDFGIQKHHAGIPFLPQSNSLNAEQEAWLNDQMWDAVLGAKRAKANSRAKPNTAARATSKPANNRPAKPIPIALTPAVVTKPSEAKTSSTDTPKKKRKRSSGKNRLAKLEAAKAAATKSTTKSPIPNTEDGTVQANDEPKDAEMVDASA